MKTLTINDLPRSCELGAKAMAGVHGGMRKGLYYAPSFDASKHDFELDVQQLNSQEQDISNNNGVNVAFAGDIRSRIKPTQTADNSLSF